jgi:hypothetical protein
VSAFTAGYQELTSASTPPQQLVQAPSSSQEQAQELSDLLLVKQNGLYGYIAPTGKLVIEPQFDVASSFSEGLAVVVMNNKFGYVEPSGKMMVSPQYDWAYNFSEGGPR